MNPSDLNVPYIPLIKPPRAGAIAAPQVPVLPVIGQGFSNIGRAYNPYDDPFAINSLADAVLNQEGKRRQNLNTLEATTQYFREYFADPLAEGDFATVGINTLMGLGETLDAIANPFKGAVIESEGDIGSVIGGVAGALGAGALVLASGGTALPVLMAAGAGGGLGMFGGAFFDDPEGAARGVVQGLGIGDQGRPNYDFNTGNLITDIALEVIADPLNVSQLAGGALTRVGKAVGTITEEVGESSARRLVRNVYSDILGEEAANRIIQQGTSRLVVDESLNATQRALMKTTLGLSSAASTADDLLLKLALYSTPVGAVKVGYDIYKPLKSRLTNIITDNMDEYVLNSATIEEATERVTRDVTTEVAASNKDLATRFPDIRSQLDQAYPNRAYEGLYRTIRNELADTPATRQEIFDRFIKEVSTTADVTITGEAYDILQEEVMTMVDTIDLVRERLTQLRPDFSFLGQEIEKVAQPKQRLSKVLDEFMTLQRINSNLPTLDWNTLVTNMRKNTDQFQALKSFLSHQGITIDDLLALDRGETTVNLLKGYRPLPKQVNLREVSTMRKAINDRFTRASKDYDTLTNRLLGYESNDVVKSMQLDTFDGQIKLAKDIDNVVTEIDLPYIINAFTEEGIDPYFDTYDNIMENLDVLRKYSVEPTELYSTSDLAELGDALDNLYTINLSHRLNVEQLRGFGVSKQAFKDFEADINAMREAFNRYDLQIKDFQSTLYKVRPSHHMARLFNLNMVDDETMQMMMNIADNDSVFNHALSVLADMPALMHSGSAASITARNIISYAKSTVNYMNLYNKLYGNIRNLLPTDETNRILARVMDQLENLRTSKPADVLQEVTVMNKPALRDLVTDITFQQKNIVDPDNVANLIVDDIEQIVRDYLHRQVTANASVIQTFDSDLTNAVYAFRQDASSLLSRNVNETALEQSYTTALNDISTILTGQPIRLLEDPLGKNIETIKQTLGEGSIANPYRDSNLMSQIRNNLSDIKQIIDQEVYLSQPELIELLEPYGVKNAYDLGTSDFSFLTVQKVADQAVAKSVFNKELMPDIPHISWLRMNERYLDNLKVTNPNVFNESYVQFLRDSLTMFTTDPVLRKYFTANPENLNPTEVISLYYALRSETGLKKYVDNIMGKRGLTSTYNEYMKIHSPYEKMAILRDAGESQAAKTDAARELLEDPTVAPSKAFEVAYNDLGVFNSQRDQINEFVRSNQGRLKDMYDILLPVEGVSKNTKRIVTNQKFIARTRALLDRPIEEVADIVKHQTYGWMQVPNNPGKYPIEGIKVNEAKLDELGIGLYEGPDYIYLYNKTELGTKPEIPVSNVTIEDNFGKEYRDTLSKGNAKLRANYHGAGTPIDGDAFIPMQANPTHMRELANNLPAEVYDNIKLNEKFFDNVQYNFTHLGDYGDVNAVLNNTPILDGMYMSMQNTLLKSNDAQIKAANLFFDGRFDAEKFVFLDDMDTPTLRDLQDNQGMTFAVLRSKNKKGTLLPHIRRYNVKSADDLAKARELGAVLIPTNAFHMMKRGVNGHRIESKLYDFLGTVMNTYKMSYLTNPGFVIRNFFDAQMKNAIETKGFAGIPENLRNSFRANRMIAEHTKIQEEIRESLEGAAWNQKAADAVLSKLSADERFRYELVNAYFNSPASAGMAQVIDDMMRELNIARLADTKTTFDKGLDMWNDKVNNNFLAKQVRRATDHVEHGARLGLILSLMDDGTNFDAAIGTAIKAHFDYSTKSAGQIYAELVIPFITFPVNNFAYWMDAAFENPELMKMLSDIHEESWSDEDRLHGAKSSNYLQQMALSGNVKVGDYLIKLNPSLYDMFQLATDPGGELESRVSGPLKGLTALGQNAIAGAQNDVDDIVTNLVPFAYQAQRMQRVISDYSSDILQGSETPALLVPSLVGKLYSYDNKSRGWYYNQRTTAPSGSDKPFGTPGWHPTGKVSGQIYNPARYVWTKRYYAPNIYKRMYTSRGNPRMAMRTQPPTPEALSYRINDIRYMFR